MASCLSRRTFHVGTGYGWYHLLRSFSILRAGFLGVISEDAERWIDSYDCLAVGRGFDIVVIIQRCFEWVGFSRHHHRCRVSGFGVADWHLFAGPET